MFEYLGKVNGGLPPFEVPAFNIGNKTFPEIVKDMGSAVIAVPMISIMETIAIGKAFGVYYCIYWLILVMLGILYPRNLPFAASSRGRFNSKSKPK